MTTLTIAPDGFLWFAGAKLPCKVTPRGLEFFEKDPHRAAAIGGPRYVVPFEVLESFIDLSKQSERKDGEK